MSELNIMSGALQVAYDQVNIMKALEEETVKALGREKWNEIIRDIAVPGYHAARHEELFSLDDTAVEKLNDDMRIFLKRYDAIVSPEISGGIFCRVRHGLTHNDYKWAREAFLQYSDIDKFCSKMREETIEGFIQNAKDGSYYHGQPVDDSVIQYVSEHPYLLYGKREGNKIIADAIPQNTKLYLMEKDEQQKRYYACHCIFAKKSILQKEGAVSKTLCNCSLGHTQVFWEAALDTELSGRVEKSVLAGDLSCQFIISLPDDIMKKYVKAGGSAADRVLRLSNPAAEMCAK